MTKILFVAIALLPCVLAIHTYYEEVGLTPFATIFTQRPTNLPLKSCNVTFSPTSPHSCVQNPSSILLTVSSPGDWVVDGAIIRAWDPTTPQDIPPFFIDEFQTKSATSSDTYYNIYNTSNTQRNEFVPTSNNPSPFLFTSSPFLSHFSAATVLTSTWMPINATITQGLFASTEKSIGPYPPKVIHSANITVTINESHFFLAVNNQPISAATTYSCGGTSSSSSDVTVSLWTGPTTAEATVSCGSHPVQVSALHNTDVPFWGDGSGDSRAGVVVNGGSATMTRWNVTLSTLGEHILPGVIGPMTYGGAIQSQPLGEEHVEDCKVGFLDISKVPFSANSSNATWNSIAWQRAIEYGRARGLVILVPPYDYPISNTIEIIQRGHLDWGTFGDPGADASTVSGSVFVSIAFRGMPDPVTKRRPKIILPPSTFTDKSKPQLMVLFRRAYGGYPPGSDKSNSEHNLYFTGIDLEVGPGNYGAMGIHLRGAQGCAVEDVSVDLGPDGLVGIHGSSGSGGSHANLTVKNGMWGIDFRFSQPAPSLPGATLLNQTCGALIYGGISGLSLIGAVINRTTSSLIDNVAIPAIATGCQAHPSLPKSHPCYLPPSPITGDSPDCLDGNGGRITIVDSIIDSAVLQSSDTPAVTTTEPATLKSTYIRNYPILVSAYKYDAHFHDTPLFAAHALENGTVYTAIELLSAATPTAPHTYNPSSTTYNIDPTQLISGQPTPTLIDQKSIQSPPNNLQLRHTTAFTDRLPSIFAPNIANILDFGADPTSIQSSDAAFTAAFAKSDVVLVPRGVYRVEQTITIPPSKHLLGIYRGSSFITRLPLSSNPSSGPILNFLSSPKSPQSLLMIFLSVPYNLYNTTTALTWNLPPNPLPTASSVIRGTGARPDNFCAAFNSSLCPAPQPFGGALYHFKGSPTQEQLQDDSVSFYVYIFWGGVREVLGSE